jgi:hypothetical protein
LTVPKPGSAAVRIASREDVSRLPRWSRAFAGGRKDHRFYELVEDTLADGFNYGYLVVESGGDVRAIQPYFIVDQDLLGGISGFGKRCFDAGRRVWPRFMRARTLMVGCSAGEGHLDAGDMSDTALIDALAGALPRLARELSCAMVVLKEFPAHYRTALASLSDAGFTRIPSMPMTKLTLSFKDFDDYVRNKLSATTRATLRRKLRVCARAQPPVTLSITQDARDIVDEIHPLYLNVFVRSPLQFEKLTKEFLSEIGARMPDRTRFFVWHQGGRAVAFALCLVDDTDVYYEYDATSDFNALAILYPVLGSGPKPDNLRIDPGHSGQRVVALFTEAAIVIDRLRRHADCVADQRPLNASTPQTDHGSAAQTMK